MQRDLVIPSLVFGSFLLVGCQTTTLTTAERAEIDATLRTVEVSPPLPEPLSQLAQITSEVRAVTGKFCVGDLPDLDTDSWARKRIRVWEEQIVQKTGRLWVEDLVGGGRREAEATFAKGYPLRAVKLMDALERWEESTWTTSLTTNTVLATFNAAAGNYDEAIRRLDLAAARYNPNTSNACLGKNAYDLGRAHAYILRAQGNYSNMSTRIAQARVGLRKSRNEWSPSIALDDYATGAGLCQDMRDRWRDFELDALEAEAALGEGRLGHAENLAGVLIKDAYQMSASENSLAPIGAERVEWRNYVQRLYPGTDYLVRRGFRVLQEVKLRQTRYEEAMAYGEAAKANLSRQCAHPSSAELAEINKDLIISHLALGNIDTAQEILDEIDRDLQENPETWDNLVAPSLERALLQLTSGDRAGAAQTFQATTDRLTAFQGSQSVDALQARAFALLSDDGSGIASITQAVSQVFDAWQASINIDNEVVSATPVALNWMVELYLQRLFQTTPSQDQLRQALVIAERLRSGTVKTALVQASIRQFAGDPATRQLVRLQQDTVRRIDVLRQQLNARPKIEDMTEEQEEELEAAVETLRKAELYGEILTSDVRQAIPNYDVLVDTSAFDLAAFAETLMPGEVAIAPLLGREASFVLAVDSRGIVTGHRMDADATGLRRYVDRVKQSLEMPYGQIDSLANFDLDAAHQLYRQLLQPLASMLSDADHLIFIGNNTLADLPMSLLLTAPVEGVTDDALLFDGFRDLPWLIRDHAISAIPSATALMYLRQQPKDTEQRLAFLGVGDPVFDPEGISQFRNVVANRGQINLRAIGSTRGVPGAKLRDLTRLPDTAEEVNAIAASLGQGPGVKILIGENATEAEIKRLNQTEELGQYNLVSFATHGLVPGDLDGLTSPALALSAPVGGTTELGNDGLLTVGEIMQMDFKAEWVALSACNTAAPQSRTNEAFSGLGMAFLYAGAKSVLLSHWPVLSDSTKELMILTLEKQSADEGRAQALRRAALSIMETGKFDQGSLTFSYAHPLFWSAFSIVGDGGA